jgi:hypothetical protein
MNNKLTKITAFSLALTALVSAGPASAAKPARAERAVAGAREQSRCS